MWIRVIYLLPILLAFACAPSRSSQPASQTIAEVGAVPDLRPFIGKKVTIQGRFSMNGKFGPFIQSPSNVIYLTSGRAFVSWGAPYTQMQDKTVRATGILHFAQSKAPAARDDREEVPRARPPDYFFFDLDDVAVQQSESN
jgi:hypothetical protein